MEWCSRRAEACYRQGAQGRVTRVAGGPGSAVTASGAAQSYPEADIAFSQPCAIDRWPDVPTRVIAGRDDRLFPLEFQRRIARDRLGVDVDVVPGGHLAALSCPAELADRLVRYLN
jgi:pimeloyl-ACP methyl ester carboxylesterase